VVPTRLAGFMPESELIKFSRSTFDIDKISLLERCIT